MTDRTKTISNMRVKLARQEASLKATLDEIHELEHIIATTPGAQQSSLPQTIRNLIVKRDRQHNTVQATAAYLAVLENRPIAHLAAPTVQPESPQRKTSARGSQT